MASEKKFVAAVDIGTTHLNCCIYDRRAQLVANSDAEIELLYPEPHAVEIDPHQLWKQFRAAVHDALNKANCTADEVAALGICTHRNTFVTWDKVTGKPLHNMLTWKDSRASHITNSWNNSATLKCLRGGATFLHFFTCNKRFQLASILWFMNAMVCMRMLWLIERYPLIVEKLSNNSLVYGCIESWLLFKLSGGQPGAAVTEISLASSTGMFDPFQLSWSVGLLRAIGVPTDILPHVQDTVGHFVECRPEIFGASIPVTALAGDQQASTYGCGCLIRGSTMISLGSGSFIDINTGERPHTSLQGLYPLVGWRVNGKLTYLAEGRSNDAANTVLWAKSIGLFDDVSDTAQMALSVPDSGGVYFVPAFHGLQAPINDNRACSMFVGLKADTTKAHLVRAVLEAIAFRVFQMYGVMSAESDYTMAFLRCCGGVSKNDFVLRTIANLTGKNIDRMKNPQFVATFGIGFLAGIAVDFWPPGSDVTEFVSVEQTIAPGSAMDRHSIKEQYKNWCKAVQRSLKWYETDRDD